MLQEKTLLVTCIGCNHENKIPIDDLLDYSCIACGTSVLTMKDTEQESLVNELDKASTELDRVIGNVLHGNMDPDMAADWIEHESSQIVEALDKARDFIEDHEN
ncbi:hypothetical protein [Paenibacillus sinopodophylli]|uniref:hypothetical protein n=1 Tax=Paenibacillus sinopodophylli TaxID=1837342 RepID=UPI00110CF7C5|nr:hypothetical protein [Paenibacillus sinopodophylli]